MFFKAALGRLFLASRVGSGKLRHRAFALVPAASGTALGSPGRGFSRFPLAGEVWKPRRARAAADFDAASFSAGAKERDAASWMYRHAKPRNSGEWLRQGRRSVPTLPCGVRDGRDAWGAFDAQTCAYRHSQSDNVPRLAKNGRSWRLQNGCVPGIPGMRKRQGARNRIVESPNGFQAVGQWPSKRNPAEVWLKVLQVALFGAQLSWDSRFLE